MQWKGKSENLAQILGYQTGAVTILPPLQESRPEILELEEGWGKAMATLNFNDLLDPTMIFLVAGLRQPAWHVDAAERTEDSLKWRTKMIFAQNHKPSRS